VKLSSARIARTVAIFVRLFPVLALTLLTAALLSFSALEIKVKGTRRSVGKVL
jgi:hypothetical protein